MRLQYWSKTSTRPRRHRSWLSTRHGIRFFLGAIPRPSHPMSNIAIHRPWPFVSLAQSLLRLLFLVHFPIVKWVPSDIPLPTRPPWSGTKFTTNKLYGFISATAHPSRNAFCQLCTSGAVWVSYFCPFFLLLVEFLFVNLRNPRQDSSGYFYKGH